MQPPENLPNYVSPRARTRPPQATAESRGPGPLPSKQSEPPASTPDTVINASGQPKNLKDQLEATTVSPSVLRKSAAKIKGKKRPKRVPTGDYAEGYCRTSQKNRFKKGDKAGPGRPRGSKSQITYLRKEFDRPQDVTEDGNTTQYPTRAIIAKLLITNALKSRNHQQLVHLNNLAQSLYPEMVSDTTAAEAYDPNMDQSVLQHFIEALQLGLPAFQGQDPLADAATGRIDLGQPDGQDTWDPAGWDTPAEEMGDE